MTTTTQNPPTDGVIETSLLVVAAVGVLGVVAGWFFGGPRVAWSVGTGAAVALANLWVLARVMRALLGPTAKQLPWTFVAVVKLLVLFGGLYGLVSWGLVDPVPLFIGYGALPVGIVLAQLRPAPVLEDGALDA